MSMVTQCPSCATTFRVIPQQLQAQQGMVRCGRCATVFDGFKTLATLPQSGPVETETESESFGAGDPRAPADIPSQSPPEAAVQAATDPSSQMPAAPPAAEEPAAQTEISAQPQEIPAPGPQPVPPAQSAGEPSPRAARSAPTQDMRAPEAQPALSHEPFLVEALPRKRSAIWALGAFLLLLALVVQGAYFYRSEIAANVPEARPYLIELCKHLRCTVALPQRPRSISIEASDMQATDPANPGLIALTATLRNHATTALGYPALDVVLTNTREHTVARRIFMPPDYLGSGTDARAGIPPNAEVTLKLNIDSGDLGAAGFRLDLLPAPTR